MQPQMLTYSDGFGWTDVDFAGIYWGKGSC